MNKKKWVIRQSDVPPKHFCGLKSSEINGLGLSQTFDLTRNR